MKLRFKERIRNGAQTAAAVLILAVFPGSCIVSGTRGCIGMAEGFKRQNTLAESIQDGLDLDCVKSDRLKQRLEQRFGEKAVNPVFDKIREDVQTFQDQAKCSDQEELEDNSNSLALHLDTSFSRIALGGATRTEAADALVTWITFPGFSFSSDVAALHVGSRNNIGPLMDIVTQECGQ